MPRIDNSYLDCPIYLYRSPEAAAIGENFGGSGFLVHIPFEEQAGDEIRSHVYAVTNSHVIRESKATVIRLNRVNGKRWIISNKYSNWIDDWDDDIAICSIDDTKMRHVRFHMPSLSAFVTKTDIASERNPLGLIDYGSDVMMVGRFIAHSGVQKNLPVVRFGTVSMLNLETIPRERKDIAGNKYTHMEESFLIECRTIPGTSGSPVFLTHAAVGTQGIYALPGKLLGIIWGYMWYNPKTSGDDVDIDRNLNTGMAQVIPAWKLAEFLNRPDLVMKRKEVEKQALQKAKNNSSGGTSDTVVWEEDELI